MKKTNTGISKNAISLIEKLNRLSEEYITVDINELIENPVEYSKKVNDAEYPMCAIIKKCFSDFADGEACKEKGTIIDIYSYENEMKYSLSQYETFPDIIKYYNYYDDNNNVKEAVVVNQVRKSIREEVEQSKLQNLDMVNYIALRHTQKLV